MFGSSLYPVKGYDWYAGVIASHMALFTIFRLKEPVRQSTSATEHNNEKLKEAKLFSRLCWLANFGGMFSMSIVWFMFPRLAVELEVPAERHGQILALGRAVVMLTYATMHFRPGWQFRFRYAVLAQLCGVLGLVFISFAREGWLLTTGVALFSLMMGFNYFASLFYSTLGNVDDKKGSAYGFNEACLAAGACSGSLLSGLMVSPQVTSGIVRTTEQTPYQLGTLVVLIVLTLQWRAYRKWKAADEHGKG